METILVPTDFSPAADNAADYAVELAKYFDARIILVNAYALPPASYEVGFSVEIISAMQKGSAEQLSALKQQLLSKNKYLTIECETEIGAPYDVIEDASKKYNADLIVMGIVGKAGKLKEHLIGSSAVSVARHIEIPTFIIPENVKYNRIHKISFACDMEKTEETDLIYIAKYFSKMFDAELEIVNVEKPQEEISYEKAETSVCIERKLDTINHKTVYVTENEVAKGLENYFNEHTTDVVMLNPKKHNIFHNLFKESVTKELSFHLRKPLLAIH
ncbi:MAG: universal stress protein [Bacteroidetes bacterium]|nr:universal stress protein [Bacteroidota bacterium]